MLLHLMLLLVASYLCYVTRNIPTKFSEGKYVAIAMLSNLQIFVVGVPVLVILGSDPQSSFFVRSIIIWMNDFVVLACIFGNLMYSLYKDRNKSEVDTRAALRTTMSDFARTSRQSRTESTNVTKKYKRSQFSYESDMEAVLEEDESEKMSNDEREESKAVPEEAPKRERAENSWFMLHFNTTVVDNMDSSNEREDEGSESEVSAASTSPKSLAIDEGQLSPIQSDMIPECSGMNDCKGAGLNDDPPSGDEQGPATAKSRASSDVMHFT